MRPYPFDFAGLRGALIQYTRTPARVASRSIAFILALSSPLSALGTPGAEGDAHPVSSAPRARSPASAFIAASSRSERPASESVGHRALRNNPSA